MSTVSPILFLPVSYSFAAGPLLVEACFGLFLSGIMTSQVYFYWGKYKHDPLWMKTLVYSVCFLETLHTAFVLHALYAYFVLEVADPLSVQFIVWSAGAILSLEMFIVALVQGFYIYRIWQLSHRPVVTLVPVFTLICRCAFGLATSILTYIFRELLVFSNTRSVQVTVNFGLVLAVVVDVMTTGLLVFYLLRQSTRVRHTRHIIHSLMFYTVNTGAITIVFSMLTLLSFNLVKFSFMFAGFVMISTKVYANSLLAMLNARNKIKGTQSKVVHSIPLTTRGRQLDQEASPREVHVTAETSTDVIGCDDSEKDTTIDIAKVEEQLC